MKLILALLLLFISAQSKAETNSAIPTNIPITLGKNGSTVNLSELLLSNKPNVILAAEVACSNQCGAILKLFRKVLTESKLIPGTDLNIITLGFGLNDTWQLARQRALKTYERFPLRDNIEGFWSFGVSEPEQINPLFKAIGGDLYVGMVPHTPLVAVLTPDNIVSSIFTTSNLSTEGFKKSIEDARNRVINAWQLPSKHECVGSEAIPGPQAARGLLAMRLGLVASLLLFFGVVFILIRRSEA